MVNNTDIVRMHIDNFTLYIGNYSCYYSFVFYVRKKIPGKTGYNMIKMKKVGVLNPLVRQVLGIKIRLTDIYCSKGLQAHMMKSNHFKEVKYIDRIPEIIKTPDYVGKTGNDDDCSIEYVKCYDDNIRLIVKMDIKKKMLYVATMFELPSKKLERFVHSGRLVALDDTQNTRYNK